MQVARQDRHTLEAGMESVSGEHTTGREPLKAGVEVVEAPGLSAVPAKKVVETGSLPVAPFDETAVRSTPAAIDGAGQDEGSIYPLDVGEIAGDEVQKGEVAPESFSACRLGHIIGSNM